MREETLRAANLAIVGHHQRMPLAEVFGTGTLSSSDGQRFPVRGKTTTGREMTIHGGQVLSTYTHVTDQHTTYGTKIIVATKREAHYVLDEILGNATDVPDHRARHRHPWRHPGQLRPVRPARAAALAPDPGPGQDHAAPGRARKPGPRRGYPHVGPLLTRRVNVDLIAEHWDDLLRLAGSLKFGHATASLIVGKLSASSRQNALAAALKEYGALRRTIYAARYLSDPAYRRKISRQLNKGESLHALRATCSTPTRAPSRARHLGDADRTGVVSDAGHQRRRGLDDRVLRPGGGLDARRGPAASTTRCWPTSPRPTARTSTSSARSRSTSTPSSPSSAAGGGRCARASSATWDCSGRGEDAARRAAGRHPPSSCAPTTGGVGKEMAAGLDQATAAAAGPAMTWPAAIREHTADVVCNPKLRPRAKWLCGAGGRQPLPAVVTGQLVGPRGFGAAARGGHHRGEDGRLGRGRTASASARSARPRPLPIHQVRKAPPNASPAPTVSTTGAAGRQPGPAGPSR